MLNSTAAMAVAVPPPRRERLPPAGHADLLRRWPTRRPAGALGRRVPPRPPLGRRRRRLRAHRARRLVARRGRRAPAASPSTSPRRGSPGCACASPARPATARCRTAPTTPSSPPPRSSGGWPPTAPGRRLGDLWEAYRRRVGRPGRSRPMLADPARIDEAIATPRAGRRPGWPRLLAHDVSPERRARRAEDEHDPRRRRPRGRHPHGPRRHDRRRSPATSPMPSASWPARSTSGGLQHVRVDPLADGQRPVGRRRTPDAVAYPGADLVPGVIVGGTDARFYRQRGTVAYGAGCSRQASPSSRSASGSTATTSASTSSRSVCAASSSTASPSRCCRERGAPPSPSPHNPLTGGAGPPPADRGATVTTASVTRSHRRRRSPG